MVTISAYSYPPGPLERAQPRAVIAVPQAVGTAARFRRSFWSFCMCGRRGTILPMILPIAHWHPAVRGHFVFGPWSGAGKMTGHVVSSRPGGASYNYSIYMNNVHVSVTQQRAARAARPACRVGIARSRGAYVRTGLPQRSPCIVERTYERYGRRSPC